MSIQFHAVLKDETGCEFGHSLSASSRDEAYDILEEEFPESSVVQLESKADTQARQKAMYDRLESDYDDYY